MSINSNISTIDKFNGTVLDIDSEKNDLISFDYIENITSTMDWCFNIIAYYETSDSNASDVIDVLNSLYTYSSFSFWINGVATSVLTIFGLIGNIFLFHQIRSKNCFSSRLSGHLIMLCIWDIALLLCCEVTYGVSSLYYGMTPFYGIIAYILYFFTPTASFCITGSIWQVLVVTTERYIAVSRPLERRTQKFYFPLKLLCFIIILGSVVLNFTTAPFEKSLKECYEFTSHGFAFNTQIVPSDIERNRLYAILVHLIPDIFFRAPLPIIAIAVLTIKTLHLCKKRRVGQQIINKKTKKNVPFMLTILNVKFVCCNTFYMFNTILMEVLGFGSKTGSSSSDDQVDIKQYTTSLYLTDLSNFLLALHGATNWLIFYNWPTFINNLKKHSKDRKTTHTISSTSLKESLINKEILDEIIQEWNNKGLNVSIELVKKFLNEKPKLLNNSIEYENINQIGEKVYNIIDKFLEILSSDEGTLEDLAKYCKYIGSTYYKINYYTNADILKTMRNYLCEVLLSNPENTIPEIHNTINLKKKNKLLNDLPQSNFLLEKYCHKLFNFAIREMKSGAICAAVEAQRIPVKNCCTDRPLLQYEFNNNEKIIYINDKRNINTFNEFINKNKEYNDVKFSFFQPLRNIFSLFKKRTIYKK
ncbi:G protein-coupled receptor, rhodopsin-like family and GPCR, rhodopsin-like, 7TM domain-containing protein [Strongyloides ratti]|uniref:G protein-coupled receptor, rhodopsin-like family and GPCR, rhodopsin-like, 7TM domain-containing protein n=1 Tax=Strongyloides ratti TaxID=34506 RepID=A0A090L1C5_STRRB|nr:G protein-coupled receptor, rhodopsin-like family and GPCR, rhodopsin-like, 7TM domain-containing protein [Strongyloides ratti]CEF63591.1 G protein-coupled receptor, rhodopsin-like family and GPCR, rhodopsin-like, 7TM domain-containing protein [Strongyloides ratti]